MPAVRPGITDQLVPLIESLRSVERVLRTEPEEPVRMPLQFGQVIQERRSHPLHLGLYRFNSSNPGLCARRNLTGFHTIRRKSGGFLDLLRIADPGALISLGIWARRGPKRRYHFQIIFRHESPHRQFTFHHHGERRRLHTPHAQFIAISQRVGTRKIHAHEPVGPAAPPCRVGQRLVILARLDSVETLPDSLRRKRGDPQTANGFRTARRFVDVAENQLAFTSGICSANHAPHAGR